VVPLQLVAGKKIAILPWQQVRGRFGGFGLRQQIINFLLQQGGLAVDAGADRHW
jgi:hypothetical protein